MEIEVSYCVVNTGQRELLLRGLDAIARERESVPFETETLVLDNASDDGSAAAAHAHPTVDRVIALPRRTGKAWNDSELLRQAHGRFALLLNEDSELMPGATAALRSAVAERPQAAAAVTQLLRPNGRAQPSAWRFPSIRTAVVGALFLHRFDTVQSRGELVREVDWAQSAALLVRRAAAEQVNWLDPEFFVYGEEVDFCRRLRDAGWTTLYVPSARAVHHEQLSTGAVPERRIVQFARGRERYLERHATPTQAAAIRWSTIWTYAARAAAATVLPNHDPRRYWRHVQATRHPFAGVGLEEGADREGRLQG